MYTLLYRYNRFTQSYLINYQDFEFEAEPELFTVLQTYYSTHNIPFTLQQLSTKQIYLSESELIDIIHMVEQGHAAKENYLRSRTFQVIDFKHFNFLLDHKYFAWFLFIAFFLVGIKYSFFFGYYLFLPRTNFYLFTNMIMIIPLYFLSRLLLLLSMSSGIIFSIISSLVSQRNSSSSFQDSCILPVLPPPMICSMSRILSKELSSLLVVCSLNFFFYYCC